jgi:hypothetical protein
MVKEIKATSEIKKLYFDLISRFGFISNMSFINLEGFAITSEGHTELKRVREEGLNNIITKIKDSPEDQQIRNMMGVLKYLEQFLPFAIARIELYFKKQDNKGILKNLNEFDKLRLALIGLIDIESRK